MTLQNENDKPTAADIQLAIMNIEDGNWVDPSRTPHYWHCVLYDPDGHEAQTGQAHSAGQAAAMAWLNKWAPDALIEASVERYDIPFEVPSGWRFELEPPKQTRAAIIAWLHENLQEFDDEH